MTVDWIYPYLTPADKATIRAVFLRWADENVHATVAGGDHPEPIGVVNDPALTSDPMRVRWSGNNYYSAHMRNVGLMALALDEQDDPDGALRGYLRNVTGAWLYVEDYFLRNDGRGGLPPEGFEYSPQALGYVAQLLLALHTAGQDNPDVWGPQVGLLRSRYWDDLISGYLHSLSPATVTHSWLGQIYQAAWYGDGLHYRPPDFMGVYGPLGLYDQATGNMERLQTLRWIETNTAPGGPDMAVTRAARALADGSARDAILYFMLFDPTASTPPDPRPAQPLTFDAPGLGRILARTGCGPDATWFTYKLGWNTISHQHADGNGFEFYRRGEWLIKERSGYGDNIASSDYHNTMALENDPPSHNEGGYRAINWQRGSQWLHVPAGDGQILARSFAPGFVYVLGDATALYNSTYEGSTDILHASRSIVWLEPDHVVIYDRAASRTAGRFKRFWLNTPTHAVVSGNRSTVTTSSGQQLFVTTLLPSDAVITAEAAEPLRESGEPAEDEPMQFRLRVEAPGGPASTRFLHVLQGADPGTSPDPVILVRSIDGTPFTGALVNGTVVLFPVDLDAPFTRLAYMAPTCAVTHLITDLTPDGGYDVATRVIGGNVEITITPGASYHADSGGVLSLVPGS